MRVDVERQAWRMFLTQFGERNRMRPTRLEVIGKSGETETDFWLEDGLPLRGTSLDTEGCDAPHVEIMLDGATSHAASHLTHAVARVRRLGYEALDAEHDNALEVEDEDGKVTILRFE